MKSVMGRRIDVFKLLGAGLMAIIGFAIVGSQDVAAGYKARLTVVSVTCVKPSTGTSGGWGAISGIIGAAVGMASAPATGGTSLVAVSTLLGAGGGVGALNTFFSGDPDDLFLRVEGGGAGVTMWEKNPKKISSQQTVDVNWSGTFDLDQGTTITLWDYDSISASDVLGRQTLNSKTLPQKTLPRSEQLVLFSAYEGSSYLVNVIVE